MVITDDAHFADAEKTTMDVRKRVGQCCDIGHRQRGPAALTKGSLGTPLPDVVTSLGFTKRHDLRGRSVFESPLCLFAAVATESRQYLLHTHAAQVRLVDRVSRDP